MAGTHRPERTPATGNLSYVRSLIDDEKLQTTGSPEFPIRPIAFANVRRSQNPSGFARQGVGTPTVNRRP